LHRPGKREVRHAPGERGRLAGLHKRDDRARLLALHPGHDQKGGRVVEHGQALGGIRRRHGLVCLDNAFKLFAFDLIDLAEKRFHPRKQLRVGFYLFVDLFPEDVQPLLLLRKRLLFLLQFEALGFNELERIVLGGDRRRKKTEDRGQTTSLSAVFLPDF
jgi:hypothetical protein